MVVLISCIIAGVLTVGVVAAFLLYVSVVSIFTVVAIITGLMGTLVFGYWAGYRGREIAQGVAGPALDSGATRTSPTHF
jgi:hypothetical protein